MDVWGGQLGSLVSELDTLNIVNFGDSIYGNFQETSGEYASISSMIAEYLECNVINAGFGGCQMKQNQMTTAPFSMCKLADAICSGDWSEQEQALLEDETLPYYFDNTIKVLKAVEWDTIDVITISYGTNDWNSGGILEGNEDLDVNSFGGALRYTIEKILSDYPNIIIIVQSCVPRFAIEEGIIVETSDTEQNTAGNTIVEYVKLAEQICKEYKIPFIDAYYDIGFNKITHDYYYNKVTDGVHLGLNGRRHLANKIAKEIRYYSEKL